MTNEVTSGHKNGYRDCLTDIPVCRRCLDEGDRPDEEVSDPSADSTVVTLHRKFLNSHPNDALAHYHKSGVLNSCLGAYPGFLLVAFDTSRPF